MLTFSIYMVVSVVLPLYLLREGLQLEISTRIKVIHILACLTAVLVLPTYILVKTNVLAF